MSRTSESGTEPWETISEEELPIKFNGTNDGDGETTVPYERALETLRNYDLAPVTESLKDDGVEKADEMEALFRRFMKACLDNPDAEVSPAPIIDEYWHEAILHTELYHDFCDQIFGDFVHHKPY